MNSGIARLQRFLPLLQAIAFSLIATAMQAEAQEASALTARYDALRAQLDNNQFDRPLHLVSSETRETLTGEIYALLDQPFAVVGPALANLSSWCDILILHLNVKRCRVMDSPEGATLKLRIGRKYDGQPGNAYPVAFRYSVMTTDSDYLRVALRADNGPFGTHDYRIGLETVALDDGRSFLHLAYSYGYGLVARAAMKTYLSTLARDKVGFSIVGHQPDGTPVYLGSVRGVVERNTMRYYLAIEAYLGALSVPAEQRAGKRLHDWYAAAERYPAQLHEIDRDEYLAMKLKEIERR